MAHGKRKKESKEMKINIILKYRKEKYIKEKLR